MSTVRSLLTLVLFGAFVTLWVWAWSKGRKTDFDAAARLPLEGDESTHREGPAS